jgi:hypothetical protein
VEWVFHSELESICCVQNSVNHYSTRFFKEAVPLVHKLRSDFLLVGAGRKLRHYNHQSGRVIVHDVPGIYGADNRRVAL